MAPPKKVRDLSYTPFPHRAPSNGTLASSSPVRVTRPIAAPAAFVAQPAGMHNGLLDILLRSDAAVRNLKVVMQTVVGLPPSELIGRTQWTLSPEQGLVPFISEVTRTPSPPPNSEDPLLHLPVLVASDDPLPEQDAWEDSRIGYSPGTHSHSERLSLTHVDTKTAPSDSKSLLLHPVHCYIPLDVINIIIASFDLSLPFNGATTVCNCALVCKDWLPASRWRLFHYLQFWRSPTRYDLFVSRVLRSERMQPWLARVRELDFEDDSLSRMDEDVTKPVRERGHRLIHDFSARFPNLLALSFRDVDWSGCPGHPLAYLTFFKQLHCLQELDLSSCRFPSFYAFWRTVAALPALRDLTLRFVSWPSSTVRAPVFSPGLGYWPKLHVFTLDTMKDTLVHTLLNWLSQAPSLSSIRSVTCGAVDLAENPEFLQAISVSVTALSLRYDSDTLVEYALSSFPRLESLNLRAVHSSEWGKLAIMLQNLPSRLRQLTIDVDLDTTDTMEVAEGNHGIKGAEGLELLDAVLGRDSFANLEFVHFGIGAGIAENADEELCKSMIVEAWENKLEKLHARGIIKLDICVSTSISWAGPWMINEIGDMNKDEDIRLGDKEEERRAD